VFGLNNNPGCFTTATAGGFASKVKAGQPANGFLALVGNFSGTNEAAFFQSLQTDIKNKVLPPQ